MKRALIILGCLALLIAAAIGADALVRQRQAATLAAAQRRATAMAIAAADADVAAAKRGLDAVPMHFDEMTFYVNAQTSQQEAQPIIEVLNSAHASLIAARSRLRSAPGSTATALYSSAVADLDAAVAHDVRYTLRAATLGDEYQHVPARSTRVVVGGNGYPTSEAALRKKLEDDPDRRAGVELILKADALLAKAHRLVLKPAPEQ